MIFGNESRVRRIGVGPELATLIGVGTGGAVGGFLGTMVGIGIPEHDARRYEGKLGKGGSLLAVQCWNRDEAEQSKRIMKAMGAEDIFFSGGKSSNRCQCSLALFYCQI